MDDIIYFGYDSENRKVVLVTDKPEIIHISECDCVIEPEPDPIPVPEPEPTDLEWNAYMKDSGNYTQINERFEILEGRYENGSIAFHFKSLADKLSMQGGILVLEPANLAIAPNKSLIGSGKLNSPRKPEFPVHNVEVRWEEKGLYFTIEGEIVQGDAATSAGDVPYNWHYGLEIQGTIQV